MNQIERKANRNIVLCGVTAFICMMLGAFAALNGRHLIALVNVGLITINCVLILINMRSARRARGLT